MLWQSLEVFCNQKKIGHTGTLDPQAKGVLAVGLGLGTKTFDLLPDHWKTYEAEVTFGVQTDTEDIWGNVLKTHDVSKITGRDYTGNLFLWGNL